jgi:hypothetical protein
VYRVDIYIDSRGKARRVKNVANNIPTFEEADRLCSQKNRDLGIDPDKMKVRPGQKYCMFDSR